MEMPPDNSHRFYRCYCITRTPLLLRLSEQAHRKCPRTDMRQKNEVLCDKQHLLRAILPEPEQKYNKKES